MSDGIYSSYNTYSEKASYRIKSVNTNHTSDEQLILKSKWIKKQKADSDL